MGKLWVVVCTISSGVEGTMTLASPITSWWRRGPNSVAQAGGRYAHTNSLSTHIHPSPSPSLPCRYDDVFGPTVAPRRQIRPSPPSPTNKVDPSSGDLELPMVPRSGKRLRWCRDPASYDHGGAWMCSFGLCIGFYLFYYFIRVTKAGSEMPQKVP